MKKLILVLAIAFMACPAFALDVNFVEVDSDTVAVVYTDADSANLPRAFALKLTMDGTTGTFDVIDNFKDDGESTATVPGFGIFPASITIDSTGNVPTGGYGSPLADDVNDAGAAGTGLTTSTVILEFGSLYYGEANAPATSGTLCTLDFTAGDATQIAMVGEVQYRISGGNVGAGVVLEDGVTADVSATYDIEVATAPGQATAPSPATGATGVSRSATTLSWTAGTDALTRDVYFGTATTPTTKVISDGTVTTYSPGTITGKKTYYWRVDEKNAVGTTTGVVWSFTTICNGDLNASGTITSGDVTLLVNYWLSNKNALGVAAINKTGYVAGMDINGNGTITSADITTLVNWWLNNKNALGVAPCML